MQRIKARDRVGDFDENSPRPPVPGEETEPCCQEFQPVFSPAQNLYRCTPRVPVCPSAYSAALLEGKAPLGFEPEGSCSNNNDNGSPSSFHEGTSSPPHYLQWAKNLSCLLEDTEGVALFKDYLLRQGQAHADALDFWFACKGVKDKPDNEFLRCAKVIWKKFALLPYIRDELRNEVSSQIRNHLVHRGLFDNVQADVAKRIQNTTYPNFIASDVYINYCQRMQQDHYAPHGSSSGSSSSSRDYAFCPGQSYLPTLHEDEVLESLPENLPQPLPLTRDSLVKTETIRILDVRPKPEAYAGVYLQHGAPVNTRMYSSYNPVSRQDSELQSLSSDARTDSDAMSCTDNSVDGSFQQRGRRQTQKHLRIIKEAASVNRDTTEQLIPRTQRQPSDMPSTPEEFAQILTRKLEAWLRKTNQSQNFVEVLNEKMGPYIEDQDNQAILDEHCQRVWSDDFTPCRTPPDVRRKMMGQSVPHPYQVKSAYPTKYPKKEKDVYSTFSADSGNIHDFPDNPECNRQFPKSRSFPEHGDNQNTMSSFEGRHRTGKDNGFRRLTSNKKTLSTELTDSGVSVISDTIPCSNKHTNEWQMSRVKESSDRTGSKHRSLKQPSASASASSAFPHRHGRKSERSGSLERCMQGMHLSEQTVQTQVSRPPTTAQLEEARRKLEMDDTQKKAPRQRVSTSIKAQGQGQIPDLSLSNNSTLRKTTKRSEPSPPLQQQQRSNDELMTTVTYSFCDEDVPYRTKVASKEVTLKQFKDLLPKKGNYRYFFKTECQDSESKAVNEEVFDDNQILPLWEGKLIALVRPSN